MLPKTMKDDHTGLMPRLIWVFAGRLLYTQSVCWICHIIYRPTRFNKKQSLKIQRIEHSYFMDIWITRGVCILKDSKIVVIKEQYTLCMNLEGINLTL